MTQKMSNSELYIDPRVADHPVALSIGSRLNACSVIRDRAEVYRSVSSATDPVQKGKETLFLTRNDGAFIRPCPGTRHYRCCGYQILHIGTFCTMDCAYCILQSYFHPPVLQCFVNHEEMLAELNHLFSANRISRVGTGEFTDSMIWERWTPLSNLLVPLFADQSRAVLELKTKTVAIDALRHLDHHRKTIVAWSLNTEEVIRKTERHTAPLSARLQAAATCESHGYPLAFHFDPMFIYDGCEAAYSQVVEQMFTHVGPENVVWISLGTFRFMPALKSVIQRRFPRSRIIYGEFVPGLDGKMRYFKPLRIRLYQAMVRRIRELAPDVTVYLCMEDDDVWQKSFGFVPSERDGLPEMLDQSAVRHCGLKLET